MLKRKRRKGVHFEASWGYGDPEVYHINDKTDRLFTMSPGTLSLKHLKMMGCGHYCEYSMGTKYSTSSKCCICNSYRAGPCKVCRER